jgi:ankyrin repeat protein
LDGGADPNVPDRTGMTPLYAAVDMHTVAFTFGRPDPPREVLDGSVAVIRTLLSHGANANAALKTRILKRVYNAGDPRLGEGATPFMRAAKGADVAVMKLLLEAGANPHLTQTNGHSPLMLAIAADSRRNLTEGSAEDGRLEAIKVCLDTGTDVNAANATGDTAAHLAATTRSGSPEILDLLWQYGATLAAKNTAGRTPLEAALRARDVHEDTITVLRRLTADQPTTRDSNAGDR